MLSKILDINKGMRVILLNLVNKEVNLTQAGQKKYSLAKLTDLFESQMRLKEMKKNERNKV